MAISIERNDRIGRTKYWIMFAVNVVAVFALVGGALAAFFNGSFALGILLIVAIVPVGIYFRVVMMRRCRDIGWPPALPWIFLGAGMLANWGTFAQIASSGGYAPGFGLAYLVGLADFAFMVVIGCIAGTSGEVPDYEAVFGPDERDTVAPRTSRPAYRGGDTDEREEDRDARWDAAIQNALGARATPPASPPRPPAPTRPAGFGRKPVG